MGIDVKIQKRLGAFQLMVEFHGTSNRIGILGASGCGKSMTLKCIAGIETPEDGWIRVGDQVLFDSDRKRDLKPQKRNIGYLFQNYALFPTMTVAQNISAGLKGSRKEKQKRIEEMIEKFQLSGLQHHFPRELSGGQQQRTALARIMAYEPEAILLDEPFSAMDVFLKDRLQQEMTEMLKDYTGTVILVSHSRDEIYRFSQELLVMEQGKHVVFGGTKEIFEHPMYREAARLTGCKNISGIRRVDAHTLEASDWGIILHTKGEVPLEANWVGYRAHDFVPVWGERKENCLKVAVKSVAELPFECNYYLWPEGDGRDKESICWFLQRERQQEVEEKGIPDYLEFREEKLMFLR
ncbi:MAG: ATP-binding cassette domain-containing protein [Lachnospiraceae bacterium]|nr:ATP-binding cassette domain-containing protein [Lachnospiraceae bacterium]